MNIRALFLTVGVIIVLCMYVGLFYWTATQPRTYVRIDCSIAEISPDIPPKAKEECRNRFLKDNK